ncbi:hypothetical protein CALCODRAFT_514755 [Calocera cornea HHB12733]|uniref:Uncharacterized protein n=1 Tax=Calocera cornea HHB12733 TaxID=1353952 RepID=A0A165J725_9BASI|nr:hypothetical protein CALCODRAFT_514755 [Calocera cornea HHB12733]
MSADQAPGRRVVPGGPGVSFDEAWPVIKSVLDTTLRQQLLAGDEPNLGHNVSYTVFMEAYTKAHNLGSNSQAAEQKRLYSALSRYFFLLADEMLAGISAPSGEQLEFVNVYLDAYESFLKAALQLPRLFRMFDIFLKSQTDQWFAKPHRGGGAPDVPPGMKLVDPNPPVITVINGIRHVQAVPAENLVPVPIERAEIDQEILQWDTATGAGASPADDVTKLLWPPDGKPVPSGDAAADARETAQYEARKYTTLPGDVYVLLVPTILRLWRLATLKHLAGDNDGALANIIHTMNQRGLFQEHADTARKLLKCLWATGMQDHDLLGFSELVAALEAERSTVSL